MFTSIPTNWDFSHSFVAITDSTGKVVKTYSFTDQNGGSWHENDPLNMAGAQAALKNGEGVQQFGDSSLDSYVENQFNSIQNYTSPYSFAENNCKDQALNLITLAEANQALSYEEEYDQAQYATTATNESTNWAGKERNAAS